MSRLRYWWREKISADQLRLVLVTCFWYLLLVKVIMLHQVGLRSYSAIVSAAGLHDAWSYLVVLALLVEVVFVFGIWFNKTKQLAIVSAAALCVCGSCLSIYSYVFKLNSDCGCGLLGQSEVGFLVQKIILLILLVKLYQKRSLLTF